MKALTQIKVAPEVVPFMERHGKRALRALERYVEPCATLDEKLGALGAMAELILAFGDSLQAIQLSKTKGTKQ